MNRSGKYQGRGMRGRATIHSAKLIAAANNHPHPARRQLPSPSKPRAISPPIAVKNPTKPNSIQNSHIKCAYGSGIGGRDAENGAGK